MEEPGLDDHVMVGGAVVTLIGSFLTFVEFDLGFGEPDDSLGLEAFFGAFLETSWTAWSNAWSIMPMVTLPLVALVLAGGTVAVGAYSTTQVPDRFLDVPVAGIMVLVGTAATLGVVAHITRVLTLPTSGDEADMVVGPGGWIVMAGSLAFLVGALRAAGRTAHDEATLGAATAPHGLARPDAPVSPADSGQSGVDPRLVTIGSAVAILVGSVLPVLGGGLEGDENGSVSAWTEGFWPLFGLPVVVAAVVGLLHLSGSGSSTAAQSAFGLTRRQWQLGLASYTAFVSVALLIGNPAFGFFGSFLDPEIGLYVMVLGSGGLVAGALMDGRT